VSEHSDAGGAPVSLVLGVGLSSDADPAQLEELARAVLAAQDLHPCEVTAVVTLDRKAEVPAVRELANTLGAEVAAYPAATLAVHQVPHPSSVVGRAVGTSSVAEAAVLAHGARLVVTKTVLGRCTLAVGAHPYRAVDQPGMPEDSR